MYYYRSQISASLARYDYEFLLFLARFSADIVHL